MGHATACMDLPCEWAQFLYTCAERGLEDSALFLIATWYREGPAMTQQFNVNHGHPDGDLLTSILAYEWLLENRKTYSHKYSDWKTLWTQEWKACSKVGLIHHIMAAVHDSVLVLQHVFNEMHFRKFRRDTFEARGIQPCCFTLFGPRSLIAVCSSSRPENTFHHSTVAHGLLRVPHFVVRHQTVIIALNRTIRDGVSYVSCLTPIPEEWLGERDWYIGNHWEDQFCRDVYQDLCVFAEFQHLRATALISPGTTPLVCPVDSLINTHPAPPLETQVTMKTLDPCAWRYGEDKMTLPASD